jgi:2,3-dihydro-2,3-dihydroxybenzoate dehydrogenase
MSVMPSSRQVFQGAALVTGAASGIGRGVALALAERGAFVVAADTNTAGLDLLAEELAGRGLVGAVRLLDVTDALAIDSLVDEIERSRPLRMLANVAGVFLSSGAAHTPLEDWQRVLDVNATGVFRVSKSVARHMARRRDGSIVTVSSNAGRTPRVGMAAYAASKAAATMFTKCLGLELASSGVRCNVVSPGSTDTPLQRAYWRSGSNQEGVLNGCLEQHRLGIPLGKIATIDDVVDGVLFLLSDQARHITLHELTIDGGATLGV